MSLTIMRRIKFCAGHRLFQHGGKCEHFHGHNYVADFFVRGSVQDSVGRVMDFADLKARCKGWLDEKKAHLLVQYVLQRAEELPDVPAVTEFAKNQADKDLVTFYASAAEVGRSFLAPPGIPADRVKALQTAFDATMKDAEFVAEVKKASLDFVPMPAAGLRKLIVDTANVSPTIVQRLQNILKD